MDHVHAFYNQAIDKLSQLTVQLPPEAKSRLALADTHISQFSVEVLQWANPGCQPPVTKAMPLMNLRHAAYLAAFYLAFVFIVGFFMRFLAPGFLRKIIDKITQVVMLPYNLVQVVLCGWMCVAAAMEAYDQHYKVICNPFDDKAKGMAFIVWVFYVSKALDFLDTVFIVLRCKWAQLTFLHVYHHVSIFLIYWMNANVGFDGDIYITVVLNSFIHFVMYLYYFLCAIGHPPPWKRLVTQFQLLQFLTMLAQAVYSFYFDCPFPPNITKLYFIYILSLFFLFSQFYIRMYLGGGKSRATHANRTPNKQHHSSSAHTTPSSSAKKATPSSSAKKTSKKD